MNDFIVKPELFYKAQQNLIIAHNLLNSNKSNIYECKDSLSSNYEYKSKVSSICNDLLFSLTDISQLNRKVSDSKERLISLDSIFAMGYYECASKEFNSLNGRLTSREQAIVEYNQEQFNEQLYKYLDDIKDNLTPEQKEIYDALKEQKVIEKKYNELQKLYEKKDDNNAFWHPVKEENLRQEILALENELREKHNVNINGYSNTWYEDFKDAGTKTGAAWVDAGKSLLKGEGLGKTLDAVKQTATTGAVVYKSAKSGVDKIEELVGDGLLAAGGSIVAGATWLFHDTWSANDVAGNVMDWTFDQVRRDRVGEANKEFYEKNPIGKWINENSNLKYDSAGAKAIQKTSKLATEIVIATAAEIGSFGAATPLVTAMFVAEGAGEAAESYAQSVDRNNGESYNYGMALGSTALGAFSGAMKGKMYGKIGANTFNILKDPSLIKTGVSLLKETGAKKVLTNELKSTSFWFDFLTTGGQKAGEVVNEYHQTGNINWGKAFTSFAGELLYARFTDKLTANSIDDIINQKSVFQTFKDMKSKVENISRKAGNVGNNIFSEVDLDDPVTFNNYMDSLTPEQRTTFMTNYYSNTYGDAFEGKFSNSDSIKNRNVKTNNTVVNTNLTDSELIQFANDFYKLNPPITTLDQLPDYGVIADYKSLKTTDGRLGVDWVPDNGAKLGTRKSTIIPAGTEIDRYGNPSGCFVGKMEQNGNGIYEGVEYGKRSLPYAEGSQAYTKMKVLKDIDSDSISDAINNLDNNSELYKKIMTQMEWDGLPYSIDSSGKIRVEINEAVIAPAYGQPGGGIQYELPIRTEYLKKLGFLDF